MARLNLLCHGVASLFGNILTDFLRLLVRFGRVVGILLAISSNLTVSTRSQEIAILTRLAFADRSALRRQAICEASASLNHRRFAVGQLG